MAECIFKTSPVGKEKHAAHSHSIQCFEVNSHVIFSNKLSCAQCRLVLGCSSFSSANVTSFCDCFQFMDVVGQVEKKCTIEELQQTFNDQGVSDYFVVFLRY